MGKLRRSRGESSLSLSLFSSFLPYSLFRFARSSMTAKCRRSFCTWFRSERRVLGAVRNRLASVAAGKYFGSFQLEKIGGLVVIRTVRPHGLLDGVSLSLSLFTILLHHPLSRSSCPSPLPVHRLFSPLPVLCSLPLSSLNTRSHPAATFLVTLETTFNNVETKGFQS